MTRRYGRARRGMRVHDAIPKNFGRNVTILDAFACTGLVPVMSVEGATDTAVFRAYVEQVLVPTLAAGDIVVMDNLSSHKVSGIGKQSKPPAPICFTCRLIRPITRQSKTAGQSSKRICEKQRPAHGRHSTMP